MISSLKFSQIILLCSIFYVIEFAYADGSKQTYPTLKVHGDELANSCSTNEKNELQKNLTTEIEKNLT